jgi:hypothetical protein
MKAVLYALLISQGLAPVHAQDAAPKPADDPILVGMARRECTALDGAVVQRCVDEFIDAHDYPDEYMRKRAIKIALDIVEVYNTPLLEAMLVKATQERAKRCKELGFVADTMSLRMKPNQVLGCGWGKPEDTTTVRTAEGTTETWHYGGKKSVRFRNGKIIAITE